MNTYALRSFPTAHDLRTSGLLVLALALLFGPLAASAHARQGGDAAVSEVTPGDQSSNVEDLTYEAAADDGPTYPIHRFGLRYLRENPLHPPLEEVMELRVTLGLTDTGYVRPRDGVELLTMSLREIDERPLEPFHASAIQYIIEAVRDEMVRRDLLGVFVAPDPTQINELGQDIRPIGTPDLTLLITTGIVSELRTVARGGRVIEGGDIEPDDRIDNPLHARHIEDAPFRPYTEGDEERTDLLRKSELDRYLFWLGRHPGRRVDASISAAQEIGGLALDLMVSENRPLVLYAQASNTGTRSTGYWRERFGFFHNQLTEHDDVLSVDYTTAEFKDYHSVSASYERPFDNDRIRWRVYGGYSEFTAAEVGFFNDRFKGDSWNVGVELIANIHQNRELFVDLIGGVRYEDIHVDNQPVMIEGDEQFLFPYLELRMDRTSEWFSTRANIGVEAQFAGLTDVDKNEVVKLGRTNADDDWVVLQGGIRQAVFLEPLLNREAWEDPSTPESSTLAHELVLSARGQYAFDKRLIPQSERTAGGLYSVRGYPESVVAGDSILIASAEYRYHLARDLEIEPEPKELFGETFRMAPQNVYGVPDWDLILKGFFDIGRVWISDPLPFEDDETLVGAGIGMEFLYKRNLNVRVDWGFALEAIDAGDVNSGANRVHVVATIIF